MFSSAFLRSWRPKQFTLTYTKHHMHYAGLVQTGFSLLKIMTCTDADDTDAFSMMKEYTKVLDRSKGAALGLRTLCIRWSIMQVRWATEWYCRPSMHREGKLYFPLNRNRSTYSLLRNQDGEQTKTCLTAELCWQDMWENVLGKATLLSWAAESKHFCLQKGFGYNQ